MPKIWRVETVKGYGPYDSGACDKMRKKGFEVYNARHTPAPDYDPHFGSNWEKMRIKKHHTHYFFGFSSLKQYRDWFKHKACREIMADFNLQLVKYDCPADAMFAGEKQVIFLKNMAKVTEIRQVNYI